MEERDFNNSHAHKQRTQQPGAERSPSKKVIRGTATAKKSIGAPFFAEDIKDVGRNMLTDVLLPAVKNTILDLIVRGARMWITGEAGGSGGSSRGGHTDYRSRYADPRDIPHRDEPRARAQYHYDDIIFQSYEDADAVVDDMSETIRDYGFASILDLYDAAGLTPPSYVTAKYGWDSVRGAQIRPARGGYGIDLPRPIARRN